MQVTLCLMHPILFLNGNYDQKYIIEYYYCGQLNEMQASSAAESPCEIANFQLLII